MNRINKSVLMFVVLMFGTMVVGYGQRAEFAVEDCVSASEDVNGQVGDGEEPPAVTWVGGADVACPYEGIRLWSKPTSERYYLRWQPVNGGEVMESDTVTIQYGKRVCDVNVYQVDKESGNMSKPYTHKVNGFRLAAIDTAMHYGTEGRMVELRNRDQSRHVTYKWMIYPTQVATIEGNHMQASVTVEINHLETSMPNGLIAVVEREFCGRWVTHDTVPIKIEKLLSQTEMIPQRKRGERKGNRVRRKELSKFMIAYDCDRWVTLTDETNYRENESPSTRYFYCNEERVPLDSVVYPNRSVRIDASRFEEGVTYKIVMRYGDADYKEVAHEMNLVSKPRIERMVVQRNICEMTPALFEAYSPHATRYKWTFGDGAYGYGDSIYHTYSKQMDSYEVGLTVETEYGCRTTQKETAMVGWNKWDRAPISLEEYPATRNCEAEGKEIVCWGTMGRYSYLWTPDSVEGFMNRYRVNRSGMYGVWVTDDSGCRTHKLTNVTFYSSPKAEIVGRRGYRKGEEVVLNGNTGSGNSYRWEVWNGGEKVLVSESAILRFEAAKVGEYEVRLAVTNGVGCEKRAETRVKVNP